MGSNGNQAWGVLIAHHLEGVQVCHLRRNSLRRRHKASAESAPHRQWIQIEDQHRDSNAILRLRIKQHCDNGACNRDKENQRSQRNHECGESAVVLVSRDARIGGLNRDVRID